MMRANFLRGMGFPLRLLCWLWVIEAVWATLVAPEPLPVLGEGLLLGLFLSLLFGLGAGLVLGVYFALSGLFPEPTSAPARLRAWIFEGDGQRQAQRSATLLALLLVLPICALGVFAVTRDVVIGMAQPRYVALTIMATHGLAVVLGWMLHRPVRNLCWVLLLRLPALKLVHVAAGLAVSGAAVVLTGFVLFRDALEYLPWEPALRLVLAILLAPAAPRLWVRLPRGLSRLPHGIATGLGILALIATLRMDPDRVHARSVAIDTTLGGRLGLTLADAVLDFDGDGHLHVLGGADCAPDNPRIYPGAVEIPKNGIDEDCDGQDLAQFRLGHVGFHRYPVPAQVPKRPPVVLITIDAFAARRLGVQREGRSLTPNLDALVERGAYFPNCFSQGPSTRLSFPSLFTSRWDSQIKRLLVGKHPYPIAGEELLLAEAMRNAGYRTVAVVSNSYFGKRRWGSITQGFGEVITAPYTGRPRVLHNSERVTKHARMALQSKGQGPLFLWAHYYDAHSPHRQPPQMPRYGRSRADLYDAELQLVDQEVGHLLEAIEEHAPQALVVVTGDHGIGFDEPRHRKFNYGYDLHSVILNVPLVFAAPFIRASKHDGVVSTMDVVPTLANLLRLGGAFRFQGISLVPELTEGRRNRHPQVFSQLYLQERLWKETPALEHVSLHTDRFHLMHDRLRGSFKLYDWRQDYYEVQDLSSDPAYRQDLQALKQQLALFAYAVYHPPEAKQTPKTAPLAKPGRP